MQVATVVIKIEDREDRRNQYGDQSQRIDRCSLVQKRVIYIDDASGSSIRDGAADGDGSGTRRETREDDK